MSSQDSTNDKTDVVELQNAVALINRFPALSGVDLRFEAGEICHLCGPNGAGKTTLLRLLAGLLPLHSGSATVFGYDTSSRFDRRHLRRVAGLLAHESFLYDELSVEENLQFWAKAHRGDYRTGRNILKSVGIGSRLASVPVRGLSAGQKRKVSLAIFVCRRPRLWLLDEPHASLDEKGRDFVDKLLLRAVEFGSTVVFASHNHERSSAIATKTISLVGGQVHEEAEQETAIKEVKDVS